MKKVIICSIIILALFSSFLLVGRISEDVGVQTESSIRSAVINSAIQCCAIDGSYPGSLKYLQDNYGLRIDTDRYIVTYDVFASNILPEVTVLKK